MWIKKPSPSLQRFLKAMSQDRNLIEKTKTKFLSLPHSLRKQLTFRNATTGFPPNDVCGTTAEIPYGWLITTHQIWVRVLLIGQSKFLANHIVGCDTSSEFFCSPFLRRHFAGKPVVGGGGGGVAKCRVCSNRLISVHYKLRIDKNVYLVCLQHRLSWSSLMTSSSCNCRDNEALLLSPRWSYF